MSNAGSQAYFRYDSSAIEAYVAGTKSLDITSTGGNLYGVWAADNVVPLNELKWLQYNSIII